MFTVRRSGTVTLTWSAVRLLLGENFSPNEPRRVGLVEDSAAGVFGFEVVDRDDKWTRLLSVSRRTPTIYANKLIRELALDTHAAMRYPVRLVTSGERKILVARRTEFEVVGPASGKTAS